jgi:hypothetical protein
LIAWKICVNSTDRCLTCDEKTKKIRPKGIFENESTDMSRDSAMMSKTVEVAITNLHLLHLPTLKIYPGRLLGLSLLAWLCMWSSLLYP